MKKTAILMLLLLTATGATVRYVSKTGTSIAPYTSWTTAADGIQKCLDICQNGDTVYVGGGYYTGTFTGGNGLTLIGSGIDKCIFYNYDYRNNKLNTLTLGSNCKVMNFTFIGGVNSETINGINIDDSSYIAYNKFVNMYRGVQCSGNAKIYNNYFISASGSEGIDSWLKQGIIEIANNYFNVRGLGIVVMDGTPLIRNNIFEINDVCSGIYTEKVVEIDNNLFLSVGPKHQARPFYAYYSNYTVQLNNVAIGIFNTTKGAFIKSPVNVIKNNIALNGDAGFAPSYDYTQTLNFGYNNSYNNITNYAITADSTNLSVDPMFVNENPDSVDVHLQAFSPMIDMGDPAIKDVDGTRSDIGLYGGPYGEEYLYADIAPKIPKNVAIVLWANKAIIHWNANGESDFSRYRIYKDTVKGFTIDSSKILMDTTAIEIGIDTLIYSGKNTYFKVTAIDKQGHISRPSEEVALLLNDVNEPKIKEESFVLYPAYPNPFNPSTRISYKMKDRGFVKLQIYTIQGELVSTLVDKEQPSGYYETDFTGKNLNNSNVASGVYLYRLEIKNSNHQPVFIDMKKMIYLK